MFRNHLKIALRQLGRNKLFSTVNILGLSLGMAVVTLIALYLHNEFNYDRWMDQSELTYRVYRDWDGGGKVIWTPSRLAEKLMADYPEVQVATGLGPSGETLLEYAGQKRYIKETAAVDSTFFRTLALPFRYGDPQTALDQPNGMVISRRLAETIFGDKNPLGEVVRFGGEDDYAITGVIDLGARHSHLDYDLYTRFQWYADSWTGNNRATYARLHPQVDVAGLEERLTAEMTDLMRREFLAMNYEPNAGDFPKWKLQPLDKVHLHSADFSFLAKAGGNIRSIYLFALIGLLVLAVAIVNYVNLATARASQRAKEVGVKKVTGAVRWQLTVQFIVESILQSLFAAAIALLLAELLLPFFNAVVGRDLDVLSAQPAWIVLGVLGLALLTGLLAGVYPAFVMSSYRPVTALRSGFLRSGDKGLFRKVLVTGQFTITIALLIVMGFIYRQVNFMIGHELGFQPDQVMLIPLNFNSSHYRVERLKSEFEQIEGVQSLTTASRFPGQFLPDWGVIVEGRAEGESPYVIFADADYARTLDLQMAKGRFFAPDIAADTIDHWVVNEAFVRKAELEEPLGARLKFSADSVYGQIIGVVKDFHLKGLNSEIRPLVMHGYHQRWYAGLKLSTSDLSATIAAVQQLWKEVEPNHPMRYSFLDDDFAKQYDEQQRLGQTIFYATLLTLFIALLGLFGLTAFNVERRTREIGIRKVLGSSVSGIVRLLSRDFLQLSGLAFLVALPVGYYFADRWLADFAFRTELSWWVFALAGLATVLVGLLTVGLQGVKAALADPIESLRSE
ncbi:MAG: ABC transporter permease [Saprospiraceae bacterium]|nr:ABC transporter permease [Saprospiraceae bacterium]